MKKKALVPFIMIACGIGLLMVGSCASTPSSRLYTLNPLPGSAAAIPSHPMTKGPTIGLGPIRFPDYLDRPGIVTRTGDNTIEIAEFDRWAGSLKEDFLRVLAGNLSYFLKTDKVIIFPYTGSLPMDFRILMSLTRFEGTFGGGAFLEATWAILKGESKKEGVVQRSRITEPVGGSDYASLVAALSRTVEKLSREIAQAVRSLPPASDPNK